tara:strand:+ start:325 stop:537 length:213 start_codon:yes stop_codon:yes gene_type:complete
MRIMERKSSKECLKSELFGDVYLFIGPIRIRLPKNSFLNGGPYGGSFKISSWVQNSVDGHSTFALGGHGY